MEDVSIFYLLCFPKTNLATLQGGGAAQPWSRNQLEMVLKKMVPFGFSRSDSSLFRREQVQRQLSKTFR
jgi:hypothetical protein